jgi:hypothetical protein
MHAFSLRSIDLLVIGLIAALSSSCGGEDVVADARIQAPRLGEASPPQSKPYAFSRSERIERVVGKLLGNTSNAAWNQSKELLAREEDPEVQRALLAFLDEQRLRSGETAGLRNAIQVMGRSEESAYGAALLGLESYPAQDVRDEAMRALIYCAGPQELATMAERYPKVDERRRAQYMRVFALRLEPAEAGRLIRKDLTAQLSPQRAGTMREQALIALEQEGVPLETIRASLSGLIGSFGPKQRDRVLLLLHRAGDPEAREELVRELRAAPDAQRQARRIVMLSEGPAQSAKSAVLERSNSEDVQVLLAVAQFLGSKNSLGGDEAGEERERSERLLEFLASNANESVRRAALEALGPKGRAVLIPQIEKRIRQDTGTTLRLAVSDAIYLRAGELVPALTARLAEAQGGGRRLFIQGLGQVGSAGAIEPLVAEFLAQPQMLNEQSGLDTVTYAALQLANIPESVTRLIELHGELGGVGSDGELGKATELGGDAETRALRRGHLRNSILMAAQVEIEGEEAQQRIAAVRSFLFAVAEKPGPAVERLHALSLLKRLMSLDESQRLVRLLQELRADPSGPDGEFMRLLNDFLWEFF